VYRVASRKAAKRSPAQALSQVPYLFSLFLLVPPALGQHFEFGVKAGVPLTSFFDVGSPQGSTHGGSSYSAATRRYTIGASGEWRVTRSLGIEINAMYHRLGYDADISSVANFVTMSSFRVSGGSWDFPILAKYRVKTFSSLYISAGGTVRHIGPVHETGQQTVIEVSSVTTPIKTDSPSDFQKRVYPGATAGVGSNLNKFHLHILPELRYTRWLSNISHAAGPIRLTPNQFEFLLGVTF
jgi:hypothetical protein